MGTYYYSCGGSCNGPVRVVSGNRSQADQLANQECGDGAGCQYLGCDGVNCNGSDLITEEQRLFRPSTEFLANARTIEQ